MGGKVRLTRRDEGIDHAMLSHRLQGRAVADLVMAIVDEQGCTALFLQPARHLVDDRRGTRASLDDGADFGIAAQGDPADAPLAVPPGAVVVPGSRALGGAFAAEHGLSQNVALLVKDRDAGTDARLVLEDALR